MRESRETKLRKWGETIQEQAASGLSVAAYCRREGVNYHTFKWWRERVGSKERGSRALRKGFVEVLAEASGSSVMYSVVLRNGREVQLRSGFRASELHALIEVLESC